MAANETITILEWVADHFHIIGWCGLGVLAWRGRGYIDRFLASVQISDQRLQETFVVAKEVKAGVDTMQTNHLSHMEKDMGVFSTKQDQMNTILTSIDKNIAILADRGRS
jgi:hypothetical protein